MKRQKGYWDLIPAERKLYDSLRAKERAAPLRSQERKEFRTQADAMLGLEPNQSGHIHPVYERGKKPWRGSATHYRGHIK